MALLLALVTALIPVAIAPGWFFYYDVTPKIILLLLGTAAAVIWWAAQGGPVRFHRASPQARWLMVVLCATVASLIVSTVFSVNRPLSVGGSNWRYWGLITQLSALGLAYLVAVCCAGSLGRLRVILRAAALSSLIVACYGIAQYFGWDPLLDPRGYHVGEGVWAIVRPPSTLGHADYFGDWMVFAVFAAAALALSEEAPGWKGVAWTSVAAGVVAILMSGTRAAMIGLLGGAVVLTLWRGLRITRRLAALSLVIAAAAAVFYLSPAGEKLRARVHWALQEPAGGARFLLWRDSLRMAASRLPVGYGPETFVAEFPLHQSADLSRAYPDFYHESPHNIFLDVLVSQGVAGPVLLLALCAIGFAAAWAVRRNSSTDGRRDVAGALVAGLAAMSLSEQFACFMLPTALAYYSLIAMLVSLTIREPLPSVLSARRWPRLAVSVPFAAVLLVFGVRLCMAESALATVRRDVDRGLIDDATSHYQDYQSWRWPGPGADLWYSRRLAQFAGSDAEHARRVQAFQQAGLAAQRAVHTAETPFNAYYNLAEFYARQNDFASTEQSLRSAISFAPNWFKTHWMLAQVLQAASRLKEAESEAALAAALDGGKHVEVTSTLEHIRAAL